MTEEATQGSIGQFQGQECQNIGTTGMTFDTEQRMVVTNDGSDHSKVIGSNEEQSGTTTQEGVSHSVQSLCKQQIGEQIRYIPLDHFVTYQGSEVYWETIPDIFQAHTLIRQSGVPNFWGMRIPVQTNLHVSNWRKHLAGYFDQQLPDLIQYGFPLDFDRNTQLRSTFQNHASAVEYSSHVMQYIQEKFEHGAIMGPLMSPPYHVIFLHL